jgi:AcrR family transcriptional regulator
MSSITAAASGYASGGIGDAMFRAGKTQTLVHAGVEANRAALYDPCRPILYQRGRSQDALSSSRYNQRSRRSQILATIRRLLTEHGFDGLTMRRIAEASGHAVQTIYSLVGSRDEAILEAINEYVRYVGRTTESRWDDPYAVIGITDGWVQSMATTPEFCRQVSLIFFTQSRGVFYKFRDQQLGRMFNLLTKQQKCGVLKADVNVRDLSEQLVVLSTGLCLEWSDRPFPLEHLHRRLYSGYRSLLGAAIDPDFVASMDRA